MKLRIFIHVLFVIFLFQYTYAQESFDNSSDTKSHSREFNLSVFTGWSIGGPINDIESNMSSSGLDGTTNFLGFTATYPRSEKHSIFDIEVSYYLAQKSGVSLNIGLINNIEVTGFEYNPVTFSGLHMTLESKIWNVSLNYAYRSKNQRHNIFAGPSYFIQKVRAGTYGYQRLPINNYEKLGAYIGYSFQVLQKKHWFIALKTNYRWAPKSEIGPYVDTKDYTPQVVEFSSTKVNLSCLNIGLHLGVRIYKD